LEVWKKKKLIKREYLDKKNINRNILQHVLKQTITFSSLLISRACYFPLQMPLWRFFNYII